MPTTFILNAPVLTTFGSFTFTGPLSPAEARLLLAGGFTSAVGHSGAAEFLTTLLGVEIAINRITIEMQPGDRALVLRLKERLSENRSLTAEETQLLGHELGLLSMEPAPSSTSLDTSKSSSAQPSPAGSEKLLNSDDPKKTMDETGDVWKDWRAVLEHFIPHLRHAILPIFLLGCAASSFLYFSSRDSFAEWANWITFLSAWGGATSSFFLVLRSREDRKRREERITINLRCDGCEDLVLPHKPRRGDLTRAELQGILGLYFGVSGGPYPQALISHVFVDGTFEEVVKPEKPLSSLMIELDTTDPGKAQDAFAAFKEGIERRSRKTFEGRLAAM